MQRHCLLFIFVFLCFSRNLIAQPTDSSQQVKVPTIIHYLSFQSVLNNDFRMHSLDTVLDDIEIAQSNVRYFYNNLSNNGSAANPQIFRLHTPLLTTFGNYSFDLYNIKPVEFWFYRTNNRFSEMTYHLTGG
jgi:hypothetical protein